MDDQDFYTALSGSPERDAAAAAFGRKLKLAGAKEHAKTLGRMIKTFIRANKPEIIGASVAGALGGGYGYAISRPRRKDGTSSMERSAQEIIDSHRHAMGELGRSGQKPSLSRKLQGVAGRSVHDLALTLKEHPVAGGVAIGSMFTNPGARLGRRIHTFLKSQR